MHLIIEQDGKPIGTVTLRPEGARMIALKEGKTLEVTWIDNVLIIAATRYRVIDHLPDGDYVVEVLRA